MTRLLCTESEASATEGLPEREARHVIRKIRRQVRLLNRKWAEVNQKSNEWQHQIDETLEVRHQQADWLPSTSDNVTV